MSSRLKVDEQANVSRENCRIKIIHGWFELGGKARGDSNTPVYGLFLLLSGTMY